MKLELKHYLPYFPNLYFWDTITETQHAAITVALNGFEVQSCEETITPQDPIRQFVHVGSTSFKPILRPLSDLTKEIEISGRKFIPLVELYKIAMREECEAGDYPNNISVKKNKFSYELAFYITTDKNNGWSFTFQNNSFHLLLIEDNRIVSPPEMIDNLELFNKLFEWHFDVFGLIKKGLSVDINTIEL